MGLSDKKRETIKYLYEYSKEVNFDYVKTQELYEKLFGTNADSYIMLIEKYLIDSNEVSYEKCYEICRDIYEKRRLSKKISNVTIPAGLTFNTKEDYLKFLYEEPKKENYDYVKFNEFLDSIGLLKDRYYRLLMTYFTAVLNMKDTDADNKIEDIKEKIHKSYLKNNRRLDILNPVLLKSGIETYYLWEDKEQKEIVSKYIYNSVKKAQNVAKCIKDLSIYFDISTTKIYELYSDYKDKQIELNDSKKIAQIKNKSLSNFELTNKKLLNANSLDEIISIIENAKCSYLFLKNNVNDFSLRYSNGNEIRNILNTKFKQYEEYKKSLQLSKREETKQKLHLEKYQLVKEVVSGYLNGNISIDEYLLLNNLDIKRFNEYVKYLNDSTVYKQYLTRINAEKKIIDEFYNEKVNELYYYLNMGIEKEDGSSNPFDIIDYYIFIGVNASVLKQRARSFNDKKIAKTVSDFCSRVIEIREVRVFKKEIMEMHYERKNNAGERILIDNNLKQNILNFMDIYAIPKNPKTFNMILNKYFNNELDLEKSVYKLELEKNID